MLPWNYADLLRFDPSTAGTKLYARIVTGTNYSAPANGTVYIWYGALEVIYAEEKRVILGGNLRANPPNEIQYGANPVRLRSVARALNPSLAAGEWTVTASVADQGDVEETSTGYPDLNGLRELYEIPTHSGVLLNLTQTPGDEFSLVQTHVLPQLSLHTSGAALIEVHGYGRQYPAPVYGSVQATQDIYDDLVGGSADFPQVRFWARRWTCTTEPLYISGVGHTDQSAHHRRRVRRARWIRRMEEINLKIFDAYDGALAPDPRLLAVAGCVGRRALEILAVPRLLSRAFPATRLVTPADQHCRQSRKPPVGSTIELTTLSMYVVARRPLRPKSTHTFCSRRIRVTGLAIDLLSQEVTGIGLGCDDGTPCCIPTAISYHRLTWPTLAMSSSGFGAFELQRFDEATDWQTIMSATDPTITGFSDFEARVGTASVYRIRVLNLYRFAGAWSDQVTGTVTGSGVTVQCATDPAGVLIFTSNSNQSGTSNLAYVSQFDRAVEEAFSFNEAGTRSLRRHYRRDYQTAYRPTERGGESFSRSMLIQGAAGALPNMGNMHSLRDMAWADLPYVCVRDDLGNRWLANVNVPAGVISQRSLYLATVDITEVTATPTEVDP
jgi:hypothetical protein